MTQTLTTHDRYLADFEALERVAASQPQWLRNLRWRAFARFQELGFPTARRGNEPWKYTNVAPIAEAEFRCAPDGAPSVGPDAPRRIAPWDDGWATLVFVNGSYAPSLSSPPASKDVRVRSLAE